MERPTLPSHPTPAAPVRGDLNPWRTIWTRPRATVRWVAENDPTEWFWLLLIAGGTSRVMARISELLIYLLPHYIEEGKSYLTIGFGCTGGRHRSVMMADEIRRRLARAGFRVKATHRDLDKGG